MIKKTLLLISSILMFIIIIGVINFYNIPNTWAGCLEVTNKKDGTVKTVDDTLKQCVEEGYIYFETLDPCLLRFQASVKGPGKNPDHQCITWGILPEITYENDGQWWWGGKIEKYIPIEEARE